MNVAIRISRGASPRRQRQPYRARLFFAIILVSTIATARVFCYRAVPILDIASPKKSATAANHHRSSNIFNRSALRTVTSSARLISSTARMVMASATTTATTTSHDIPPNNMRGLFAGSGVEGLSNPLINEQILNLLPPGKKNNEVNVLYLGTATYDIALFREKQTARFADRGCRVSHLDVANTAAIDIDIDECASAIRAADVLLVGGGNTLFAVDRWHHLGLVPLLREAMERGCILAGGSAGAICWFDSGHSDSADPETYRTAMLNEYGNSDNGGREEDESSEYDPSHKKGWRYLRCPGLGFVPGPMVCCPHHDKVQSNGLLRANDFDEMLLARAVSGGKSVIGMGIDHYSAFVVRGDDYEVYSLPDKPGSVNEDGFFDVSRDGTPNGKPGVWIKRVIVENKEMTGNERRRQQLRVEAMVCPPSGKLADLLAYGGTNLPPQNNVERDENQASVDKCRRENPSGRQF